MTSYELEQLNEELKGDLDTIRAEYEVISEILEPENSNRRLRLMDLPVIKARIRIIEIAAELMKQHIEGARE